MAPETAGYGLSVYDSRQHPLFTGGNLYLRGARPYSRNTGGVHPDLDSSARLEERDGAVTLILTVAPAWCEVTTALIATETLGRALVPDRPYEDTDGAPLRVDRGFAGRPRDVARPHVGPWEPSGVGKVRLRVW